MKCLFSKCILGAVALSMMLACQSGRKPSLEADKVREYASALMNRSLFQQAIEQYEIYLRDYPVSTSEQAGIYYVIANTYFDRIRNYEQALTYYLKIKYLYSESNLTEQVNKKIIACLERLDRSTDAQQALSETVALDPSQVQKKRPGAVVARIGDREVTQGDLDYEIDQLPPSVREQLSARDKKLQFLQEYVATEIMYDTAKRAGLDNNPEVVEGSFQAKKMLMVRKLMQDKVTDRIKIIDSDVQLYYGAHKDQYAETDKSGKVVRQKTFEEVKQQVAQDLYREKYQHAYLNLMQQMLLAENVKFFEDQVH